MEMPNQLLLRCRFNLCFPDGDCGQCRLSLGQPSACSCKPLGTPAASTCYPIRQVTGPASPWQAASCLQNKAAQGPCPAPAQGTILHPSCCSFTGLEPLGACASIPSPLQQPPAPPALPEAATTPSSARGVWDPIQDSSGAGSAKLTGLCA